MTPRTLLPLLALACLAACGGPKSPDAQDGGQQQPPTRTPVTWTAAAAISGGTQGTVTLDAAIAKGWHVYSTSQPAGGPIATRITLPTDQPVRIAGDVRIDTPPATQFDSAFGMSVQEHEGHARFTLPITVASSPAPDSVRVNVRYQTCNDSLCLPPQTAHLTAALARGS